MKRLEAIFLAAGLLSAAGAGRPVGVLLAQGSATPASSPASMDPADVRALLYKVYTTAFRVTDLASTLQPENLNISEQDRASLSQKLDALRAALTALEKPRGDFYNHPGNLSSGEETIAALKALLPRLDDFRTALAASPGGNQANDYQQPAADLAGFENQLEPYVSYLETKGSPSSNARSGTAAGSAAAPAPTGIGGVQTAAPAPAPIAAPGSTLASMDPADVRALLHKVYTTAFRVTDLASTLQPENLKISDQDRASLGQKLDALRAALTALEKPRGDFYNRPDDVSSGEETIAALKVLLPRLDDFRTALSGSPGPAQANDYQQPAADLAGLESRLEPYVTYLEANAAGGVAAELKTERVQPSPLLIPLTSSSAEKPPLDQPALKQLLSETEVPTARIKDLLGQEHPESWHAPEGNRSVFSNAKQALEKQLVEFETWRGQFAGNPLSLEFAFQTYRALWSVTEPLDAVSRVVRQSEDPKLGAEYSDRGLEIAQVREKLVPYINYLLRYHDLTAQTFQQDLVGCENQLGYAMRPRAEEAVPMKNILPVFQGRRVREREANSQASSKEHSAVSKPKKKPAKPSSNPAR